MNSFVELICLNARKQWLVICPRKREAQKPLKLRAPYSLFPPCIVFRPDLSFVENVKVKSLQYEINFVVLFLFLQRASLETQENIRIPLILSILFLFLLEYFQAVSVKFQKMLAASFLLANNK